MKAFLSICASITFASILMIDCANVNAEDKVGISVPKQSENKLAEQQAGTDKRLLVKFSKALSDAQINSINERLGARVVNRMLDGQLLLLEVHYPSVRGQIIDAYSQTEGILYAEADQNVGIPNPEPDNGVIVPKPDEDPNGSPPLIDLPKVE